MTITRDELKEWLDEQCSYDYAETGYREMLKALRSELQRMDDMTMPENAAWKGCCIEIKTIKGGDYSLDYVKGDNPTETIEAAINKIKGGVRCPT